MNSELLIGWPLVFLIAAAQGLFFGGVLISRATPNRYLGVMLLSFSFMMLYYVAFWTRLHLELPRMLGLLQGSTYLIGIGLYFFIRSRPGNLYFNWNHLIPASLYVVLFFIIAVAPSEHLMTLILTQVILQIAHLGIYFYLSYKIAKERIDKNSEWNKKIVLAFGGYSITFLAYYIMVWTGVLKVEYDYMVSAASTFFIYLVGFYGFKKPDVLKLNELQQYSGSSIDDTNGQIILNDLKTFFEHKQPFLNSSLKLGELAQSTGYSANQISQVLNAYAGQSFNDFVNAYRIEYAINLIHDEPHETLINVAYSSGFNNKNSFANSFKKITGTTPSLFKQQMTSQMQMSG